MSSKIGVILSMLFVALFFMFAADMISLQYIYSELDAKGVSIAYHISKSARIDDEFVSFLSNKYILTLSIPQNQSHDYGDVVEFYIKSEFTPIVISKDSMPISLKRSAVIGYYG